MKNLLHIGITLAIFVFVLVNAKNECDELKEQELQMKCEFTDFEEYRKCIKERKEIRRKRATICPISGKIIDIDKLSGTEDHSLPLSDIRFSVPAVPPTAVIPSIQPQAAIPPVLLADQPLYASPAPQVVFDSRPPEVNHNWIVQGEDTNFVHNQRYHPARNVTTIIKLTNHINNTNIVNVPTHINATNVNNITIFTNSSENSHDFGYGVTKDGPCCMVVKPKTCHTGPMGPRCHHRRHKMCGNHCTSRTMHVRSHRSQSVGYIPQPSPRCIYSNQWPFVNCGHRRRDPCDGCYDHYGSYGLYEPPSSCHGCYDEGFEYGQMYRRGPVLRPHYYHRPPPFYETGYQGYQGYGSYYDNNDYNDQQGYMPQMYPEYPNYSHGMETSVIEDDYSRENNTSSTEKRNGTSQEEGDWGIAIHKCKVISDDGSVSLANCTVDNEHPYAAAPSDFSYPAYNDYYAQPYPAQPYPEMYYNNFPPSPHRFPPQGFPGYRRAPSNHAIAPIKSRKSSSEVVIREIEPQNVAKVFPEDDQSEQDPDDYDK